MGSVSKACRIAGYSRQQFYEIRRNFQVYGAEAILAHALAHPTHGAQRVADEFMFRGVQVSWGGVRGVWIRNGLITYTGSARTAAAAWRADAVPSVQERDPEAPEPEEVSQKGREDRSLKS